MIDAGIPREVTFAPSVAVVVVIDVAVGVVIVAGVEELYVYKSGPLFTTANFVPSEEEVTLAQLDDGKGSWFHVTPESAEVKT